MTRRFYNSVSRQLDLAMFGKYSFFLNYGYVPDRGPQRSRVKLPDHYLNKNCVKLVLEVIADCVLTGCQVLDVGCGRGGTIHVINKFYDARQIVGMDLARRAISFCKDTHQYPSVSFLEGDAENLPFKDSAFDVVTNIESSHSYPDIPAFYAEIFRVLKPGGYFLYADSLPVALMNGYVKSLQELDFTVEEDRDITPNVLLSCDETARLHLNAFNQNNNSEIINNFLGIPGSQVYDEMKTGRSAYRIFKLRKGYFKCHED